MDSAAEPGLVTFGRHLVRSARQAHPGMGARAWWRTLQLIGRQAAHFRSLRRWHRRDGSALREALDLRPRLVEIVNRPYINIRWNTARKMAAIEEHHALLMGPAQGLRAAMRQPLVAARLAGLELVVDAQDWFMHEGELSLNLRKDGLRIYSLMFTLGFSAGRPVAWIGGIQGLRDEAALALYRTLTHELHGLRPRDLLIDAFRMVCACCGVQQILAVSDEAAVCRSAYFAECSRVLTSYDAVWADHDGVPGADGFHELAVARPRREPEAIPSRKRSLYRRRYDMLDGLQMQLAATLATASRPTGREQRREALPS